MKSKFLDARLLIVTASEVTEDMSGLEAVIVNAPDDMILKLEKVTDPEIVILLSVPKSLPSCVSDIVTLYGP